MCVYVLLITMITIITYNVVGRFGILSVSDFSTRIMLLYIYTYTYHIYIYMIKYNYKIIYIYIEREREREIL